MFNISTRRVGGIRFVRIGRLCFSFCLCAGYRDLNAPKRRALPDRKFRTSIDGVLVLGFTDE